ncbi:hypothetical protein BaRGS_00013046 [Batillaria attramentaria]|uniref:Uncharacterized protein n=1 Tax=Batillaria attramentaria TaxID=370345 RepID=A0ABD0L7L7_9CAEN
MDEVRRYTCWGGGGGVVEVVLQHDKRPQETEKLAEHYRTTKKTGECQALPRSTLQQQRRLTVHALPQNVDGWLTGGGGRGWVNTGRCLVMADSDTLGDHGRNGT